VIAPEAQVKLFVIASVEARAARRYAEMVAAGREVSLEEIAADLAARDARDAARAQAPLRAAEDAVVLDTSALDREAAIGAAVEIVLGVTRAP
jgi:cytidylate kinase